MKALPWVILILAVAGGGLFLWMRSRNDSSNNDAALQAAYEARIRELQASQQAQPKKTGFFDQLGLGDVLATAVGGIGAGLINKGASAVSGFFGLDNAS